MFNCEIMKIMANFTQWDVEHSTSLYVCVTELQHALEVLYRTGGTS